MIFAVVIIAGSYIYFWQGMAFANQAEIQAKGQHWANIDVFQSQILTIDGKLGKSVIEVAEGKVRFIASPCSNKLCILQGWIEHSGEVAICLPNEVSVQILGPDPRYDTINF